MSKELLQQALNTLKEWDALIKHQYTGTSEGMSDMQHAAWHTVDVIAALEAELAKPEQKGVSSGLCLHSSALNYLDKEKVHTRLDYQPYTGVGEALEKELGESNA